MYSHDGLKDSLTNLAAPPLFYEELKREVARANRSREEVQILRLILSMNLGESISDSQSAGEILELAQILSVNTRAHDVCARMGEREFLVLQVGNGFSVVAFMSRVFSQWILKPRKFSLTYSSLASRPNESSLELLNRVDLEKLSSCDHAF